MEKFTTLTAVAAPLLLSNIDTDTIIPMARYVTAEREAMHEFAFEPLRFHADGSENLEFVLNQPQFRGAEILLSGPNFGCGSSRESAVWALAGLGIRVIIAPSFGGIFYANCFQSGLLPVILPQPVIEEFAAKAEADPEGAKLIVDLEYCSVGALERTPVQFEIEPFRRAQLLGGLDDIGMTMTREAEIAEFQKQDQQRRAWIYL
jgi:3-isopropylmalate/(R)-2-methylmalate dehydratase small subunit